jgi:hypothetical protein
MIEMISLFTLTYLRIFKTEESLQGNSSIALKHPKRF